MVINGGLKNLLDIYGSWADAVYHFGLDASADDILSIYSGVSPKDVGNSVYSIIEAERRYAMAAKAKGER
jgi:hypothetical protein